MLVAMTANLKPRRDRLRRARVEAGLTQEELAIRVGASVFSIGKYERGERSPRGPMLRRIAKVTGKTTAWFFENEDGLAA
jgi:transcriptional regulator with XRE-family HTH domain